MASQMQLVITENKQIIKTLTTETNSQASHLVKSLQEFQQLVNATLTNIIEGRGGNNQEEDEDESDESEEDAEPVTPKKRKK